MPSAQKIEIFPLDLKNLTHKEKQAYRILTIPKYRVCLDGLDPYGMSNPVIVAVGVKLKDEIVGLSLASVHKILGIANIFCLHIKKNYRKAPSLLALLQKTEQECKKKGSNLIDFYYHQSHQSTPLLKRILHKNEWIKPKLFMYRLFFDSFNFYPPWYDHTPKLPKKFTVFLWKDLQQNERNQLYLELKKRSYPPSISPFFEEDKIEPINSIGLKYQDQIIGWAITHRIAHDTIRYTSLYIKPEFQYTGYSITLLVKSIRLQQKHKIRWSIFEINVNKVEEAWLTFVENRLKPYSFFLDHLYKTLKTI